MPDRPILFASAMVRALIEGRKTQTRRLATSSLSHARSGERLWVRESWADATLGRKLQAEYMADHAGDPRGMGWRPSIHMPRWASRLTLLITKTRRERLQDISADDARAEGLTWISPSFGIPGVADSWHGDPRRAFRALWSRLHGSECWDANPDVVVLEYSVTHANIDHMERN